MAGRKAATLTRWTLTTASDGSGAWTLVGSCDDADHYWLYQAVGKRELRLPMSSERTWRFRDVTVSGGSPELRVTGVGQPDIL